MADVATVFGGSGFIGRYVVRRLARTGKVVRVAVRNTDRALFLKTAGKLGQIVPLHAPIADDAAVKRAVEDAEWVVNLVGILAESRAASFQMIHVEAAAQHVRVDVVEAGEHRAAARIHHLGARPAQAFDVAVAADDRDPVPADGERLAHSPAVARIHRAVDDDEIGGRLGRRRLRREPIHTDSRSAYDSGGDRDNQPLRQTDRRLATCDR